MCWLNYLKILRNYKYITVYSIEKRIICPVQVLSIADVSEMIYELSPSE